MISLLLSIIPIIVSAGIIGMVVMEDILVRSLLAIVTLAALAYKRIRTE